MVSLGQLVGVAAAGAVAVWGMVQFSNSGIRDELSAIRTNLGNARPSGENTSQKLNDTQLALTKEIQGLRVDLTEYRGDFKALEVSLDDMKTKVDLLYKASITKGK